MTTEETLRTWAMGKYRLGLARLAEDMPRVRDATKTEIIDWLLTNEPSLLAESYHIEQQALGGTKETT